MEEQRRKRGRPKKDGSKNNDIHLRLSDEEMKMILDGAKSCGESCSDFLRNSAKFRLDIRAASQISSDERMEFMDVYGDGYDDYYEYD